MLYEFRKLYADLVAADGTFVVLYLSRVRLGAWQGRGSVEVYFPDGRREALQGCLEPTDLDPETPLQALPLQLALPGGGRFALEAEVEAGPWAPSVACPADPLCWRVVAAHARMTARWTGPRGERTLEGPGYVDLVRVTRATRLLGLSLLRWGRAHLPGRSVVFEDLALENGRRWTVALDAPRGEVTRPTVMLDRDGAGAVRLQDGELFLSPARVLHRGNAFAADRIPGKLDRVLCEAVGGPTHQVRWLGEATCGGARGPAVWEQVRFGREAARGG